MYGGLLNLKELKGSAFAHIPHNRYIYCFLSLQSYTRNVCTIVHSCLSIQHFIFGTYPVPLNTTNICLDIFNKQVLNENNLQLTDNQREKFYLSICR